MRPFYPLPQYEWWVPPGSIIPDAHREDRFRREEIRQWILRELFQTYEYPLAWLQQRIQFGYTVALGNQERTCDLAMHNPLGEPFLLLLISDKNTLEMIGGANDQMRSFMTMLPSVYWGITTNGEEYCIFYKTAANQIKQVPHLTPYLYNEENRPKTKHELIANSPLTLQDVLPKFIELINFLNEAKLKENQVISAVIQLLFVKVFDEQKRDNEPLLFQQAHFGSADEFASTLISFYQTIQQQLWNDPGKEHYPPSERGLFPANLAYLPPEELYTFWMQHLQHLVLSAYFDYDGIARLLDELFASLLSHQEEERGRGATALYYLLQRFHERNPAHRILDGSCGTGELLIRFLKEMVAREQHALFNDYSLFYSLTGIERNPVLAQLAYLKFWLSGYKQPHIFLETRERHAKIQQNYYELVLGLNLGNEEQRVWNNEALMTKHLLDALQPSGLFAFFISNTFLADPDRVDERLEFIDQVRILALVTLPSQLFSGETAVQSRTLVIGRKGALPAAEQSNPEQHVLIAQLETGTAEEIDRFVEEFFTRFGK